MSDPGELLEEMGLSRYEAKVYENLLNEGPSDAQEVSQQSGVPKGRIYDVFDHLADKGLVEPKENSRPKLVKAVKPRIALKRLVDAKEEKFEQVLNQMHKNAVDLMNELSKYGEKDRAVLDREVAIEESAIHSLFKEQIAGSKEEILSYLKLEEYDPYDDPMFNEMIQSLQEGVEIKIILPEGDICNLEDLGFEGVVQEFLPFLGDNLKIRVVERVHHPYDVVDEEKNHYKG